MVIFYIVITYYSGTGLLVPAPFSIVAENTNNSKLGTNNQKLILFSLGNAMSGPPTNNGNKKFIVLQLLNCIWTISSSTDLNQWSITYSL